MTGKEPITQPLKDLQQNQNTELRSLLDSQGTATSQIQEKIEFYKKREAELNSKIKELEHKLAQLNEDHLLRIDFENDTFLSKVD